MNPDVSDSDSDDDDPNCRAPRQRHASFYVDMQPTHELQREQNEASLAQPALAHEQQQAIDSGWDVSKVPAPPSPLPPRAATAGVHAAQGELTLGQFLSYMAMVKLREEYRLKCDAGQRRDKVEVSCAAAVAAQLPRAAAFRASAAAYRRTHRPYHGNQDGHGHVLRYGALRVPPLDRVSSLANRRDLARDGARCAFVRDAPALEAHGRGAGDHVVACR